MLKRTLFLQKSLVHFVFLFCGGFTYAGLGGVFSPFCFYLYLLYYFLRLQVIPNQHTLCMPLAIIQNCF